MEVLGDSFTVRRIQPQLLQMALTARGGRGILLCTCVVQQFAPAWEHWTVKWLGPRLACEPFCTAQTLLFLGLFIVFTTSFSSLYSWVPLPAVGSLPVLRGEDGAVGVPRASLHGHRCSQRTRPVSDIPCHQVITPPPTCDLDSFVGISELKWTTS